MQWSLRAAEPRVCARPVGGAAAGARVRAQPEPGARQHPEREAGAPQYDQLVVRPAARLPHLRVAAAHLVHRVARAARAPLLAHLPAQPARARALPPPALRPVRAFVLPAPLPLLSYTYSYSTCIAFSSQPAPIHTQLDAAVHRAAAAAAGAAHQSAARTCRRSLALRALGALEQLRRAARGRAARLRHAGAREREREQLGGRLGRRAGRRAAARAARRRRSRQGQCGARQPVERRASAARHSSISSTSLRAQHQSRASLSSNSSLVSPQQRVSLPAASAAPANAPASSSANPRLPIATTSVGSLRQTPPRAPPALASAYSLSPLVATASVSRVARGLRPASVSDPPDPAALLASRSSQPPSVCSPVSLRHQAHALSRQSPAAAPHSSTTASLTKR